MSKKKNSGKIKELAAQGLTAKEIAEQVGCDAATVRNHAKALNIEVAGYKRYKKQENFGTVMINVDEIESMVKAYARSLGVQNTLVVRRATPAELAEFSGIGPIKRGVWTDREARA